MKVKRFLLTILMLAASGVAGPAFETVAEKGTCPRCGGEVRGSVVLGLVERKPPDPDLCARHLGDQPYLYQVWSCSSCGFSAYADDFLEGRFPRGFDLRTLPLLTPKEGGRLGPEERYLNAFEYYRAVGRDPIFLGNLLQRGAWAHRLAEVGLDVPEKQAIRDTVIAEPGHISVPEWALYERAWRRIPEDPGRPDLLLLKAEWMRRAGQAFRAKDLLESARGEFPPALAGEVSAVSGLIESELRFLRMAELQIREACATMPLEPKNVAAYRFLVGELNRRLGRYDEARLYFARVVESEETSEELWFWSWGQLRLIHHPETHPLISGR